MTELEKKQMVKRVRALLILALDLVTDIEFDWVHVVDNTTDKKALDLQSVFFNAVMNQLELDYDSDLDVTLAMCIAHAHCASVDLNLYEVIFGVIDDESTPNNAGNK